MRRLALCLLLLAPAVPVATAQAQTAQAQTAQAQTAGSDIDSVRRSLGDALSFATFGAVNGLAPDAQVSPEGDAYRIHLPVTGLIAPSDPAVTALARPTGDGAWDVQSLTFPSHATIESNGPASGPGGGKVTYTIGRQDITAHIVPDMKQPTTYAARLEDIHLQSEAGGQRARQTLAHYAVKGSITADGDGRVGLISTGEATGWAVSIDHDKEPPIDFRTKRVSVDVSVQGLDKAKGERLRAGLHTLLADLPKPGADSLPAIKDPRGSLRALLDDATGLLNRFEVNETLEGVTLSDQHLQGGAGTVIIGLHGDTANQDVDAGMDLAINDVVVPAALSGPYAAYVPKHISLRNRIHGLPSDQVVALLRAALAENADPMALQAQALRLLRTPGASVSVDPFNIDAGPLALTGTAHLLPSENGGFAGHIHIVASGMDALISQAQGNQAFGHVMPMLYMAKGMGKADGKTIVWDIDLDERGVRINGTPFGHPPPKR
ncbi:MAG TPA: DUF2125 domain-containing protein [Rhodopila sp.]|uniref:DUF2125 domain-containing protein n=1 Tax=Rhodopila sp. TaxID=2480087 RepID=UPI002C74254C|nr:DUF2125 domain-containing protein [Rhodopila sp.]HVY17283.1 DUF2125 domain-containing protein [Rhodopila sp.]